MRFAAFFGEETPFLVDLTDLKIAARWSYDWCGKIFKIWENGRKVCAHYFDHLEASWKKTSTTVCNVDVQPYKNISLPRYRVPRKTIKFVPMVPKAQGRDNVCAHRKSIKPCNFQKCFGYFIGDILCSCAPMFKFFSNMARWRPYGVSNFKRRIFRFSAHVLLWFLNNVYS